MPALIEVLDSEDVDLRYEAASALAKIGAGAREALPALRGKLADAKDNGWRVALADALGMVGDQQAATDVLAAIAVNKEDVDARPFAIRSLIDLGPKAARALPALQKALRDETDPQRAWIALAVCRIGRRTKIGNLVIDQQYDGFVTLDKMIRLEKRIPRLMEIGGTGAGWAVKEMGREAGPLVPALLAILKDCQSQVDRLEILDVLGRFGPDSTETVPALEGLLKASHDKCERVCIATTLMKLGRPQPAVLRPILLDWVRTKGQGASFSPYDSVEYLGNYLGPEAKSAVPLLLQMMRHEDYKRYLNAASALVAIDPQAAAKAGVYDPPR